AVGVGEDRELPAALSRPPKGIGHLGERLPARERAGKRIFLSFRCAEPAHRLGQHLAVGAPAVGLELGLELVVAVELLVGALLAEDARELATDSAVPIDQRAVAVERRPPVRGHAAIVQRTSPSTCGSTPTLAAEPRVYRADLASPADATLGRAVSRGLHGDDPLDGRSRRPPRLPQHGRGEGRPLHPAQPPAAPGTRRDSGHAARRRARALPAGLAARTARAALLVAERFVLRSAAGARPTGAGRPAGKRRRQQLLA